MIALITDFGTEDFYTGVVKGVIKKTNPNANIVDISHSIASYSIPNAQYFLYSTYRYFPHGTVFFVVVDPGVGTARRGLIAKSENYYFVMPDNGILSAVQREKCSVYAIDNSYFPDASNTFHGRDIFAPVAAKLDQGIDPESLGEIIHEYIDIKFPDYTLHNNSYECKILHVDKFGNLITSVPNVIFKKNIFNKYTIKLKSRVYETFFSGTYGEIKTDKLGILIGSSGFIEISLNAGSASKIIGLNIDDKIIISYED